MRKLIVVGLALVSSLGWYGCIDLGTSGLLPVGTSFVVRGTMTVPEGDGCPVWAGENGQNYYLYQGTLLDNALFDRISTPGVTSRLVISTRGDLTSPCKVDQVAQVTEVLEIVQ